MPSRPIRVRRVRRSDFDALTALLDASELSVPGDDRQRRSRFRRLVADLGSDPYVALVDDQLCGVIHVSYARHLLADQQATLELLVVAPAMRRHGVGRALAAAAVTRARARGCRRLHCRGLPAGGGAFFTALGWHAAGERVQFDLAAGAN
jgi:GNAT superfamily N-acetyltransferase